MVDTQIESDTWRLAESLGVLPEPAARPVLVVVSGLPGTGKSYFSRQLAGRVPSVILESDALRKVLFRAPTYSAEESFRLFQAIHRLIEMLLQKGFTLILDATNLSERHRERLYNIADRLNVKLILVRIEAPPEVVQARLNARIAGASPGTVSEADWSVYEKLKSTVEKIRRSHFVVDTSRDITPVIDKIIRDIKKQKET